MKYENCGNSSTHYSVNKHTVWLNDYNNDDDDDDENDHDNHDDNDVNEYLIHSFIYKLINLYI